MDHAGRQEPDAAGRPVGHGEERQEQAPARRIRHARETAVTLDRITRDPTPENIVALHELHANHLRELGDAAIAIRADERANHARSLPAGHYGSPFLSALIEALPDSYGGRPSGDTLGSEHGVVASATSNATLAEAGLHRGRAALQRAAEAVERIDSYAARAAAARERSAAARRRLNDTRARMGRSPFEDETVAGVRDQAADERERVADKREQTADERDRLADVRDKTADRRDRIADEREKTADRRNRDDR